MAVDEEMSVEVDNEVNFNRKSKIVVVNTPTGLRLKLRLELRLGELLVLFYYRGLCSPYIHKRDVAKEKQECTMSKAAKTMPQRCNRWKTMEMIEHVIRNENEPMGTKGMSKAMGISNTDDRIKKNL